MNPIAPRRTMESGIVNCGSEADLHSGPLGQSFLSASPSVGWLEAKMLRRFLSVFRDGWAGAEF
jgi:hypothetical protein